MNPYQYPANGMIEGQQPGMGNPYGMPGMQQGMGLQGMEMQGRNHTTKREILEYIKMFAGTQDLEQVDSFETLRARHICAGTNIIKILDKNVIEVPLNQGGSILVETFFCPMCRKILVNKQSLEFY